MSTALRLLATLDSLHEVMWMQEVLALVLPKDLRAAFEGLTPGRQREYNLHFSDAKKAETRKG